MLEKVYWKPVKITYPPGSGISSYHYGSDVEDFWGNDEYEYYFIVDKDDVPKFLLESLTKGFNSEEKFTLHDLKDMCDKKGIKYATTSYV